MAEDFFESLADGMKRDAETHPGQTVDPEVLKEFMTDRRPAAPWTPDSVPAPAARTIPPPPIPRPVPRPVPFQPGSAGGEAVHSRIAPAPASLNVASLEELQPIVLDCQCCPLAKTRHHVVFGEGDPHAKLMFIGEGPGYDEDMQGRPFVGKAGKLLDKMIAAMQFKREEVYIGNVVKCRPPGNRVPSPDEAAACIGYLRRQIELIHPEVIVLLGATAVNFLLGRREGITRLRGKWLSYNGIPVMPTFHPAYLLRQPSGKREAWADLQTVMKVFGKVYQKP